MPPAAIVLAVVFSLVPLLVELVYHDTIRDNIILEDIWFLNLVPVVLLTYYLGRRGSLISAGIIVFDLAVTVLSDLFLRCDFDLFILDLNSSGTHAVLMLTGTLLTAFAIGSLTEKLQEATSKLLLEERLSLARDVHDSLAQQIGVLNVNAAAINRLLANGETERARRQLAEIRKSLRSTYDEVRQLISYLKTRSRPTSDPWHDLGRLGREFEERTGIRVFGDLQVALDLDLHPDRGFQLARIVQEALSNVRKHPGLPLLK